jgi:ribosomal protein S18 acetylase RimI-like enzyme
MLHVRPARPEDARRVAEIHLASWQTAFRGLMPDDFLDKQTVEECETGWAKTIEEVPGKLLVAVRPDSGILGFVCQGPVAGPPRVAGYQAQIFGLHVSPEAKRQGIGLQLMRAAFARLSSLRCRNAYVLTLEGNEPARRFYEKLGGREVARGLVGFGGRDLVEVAYGWERLELP